MIILVFAPIVSAEEELSTFNEQGDIDYPKLPSEDSYLATRTPMASEHRSYIGIGISPVMNYIKSQNSDSSGATYDTTVHKVSYAANIYGGVGTNFRNFYLGSELNAGYDNLNRNITVLLSSNTSYTVKKSLFAGLDLIPGYLTDNRDILFYGRIGLGSTLYKITPAHNVSASQKVVFNLRTGVGIEYFMNENFSLRAECLFNAATLGSGITKTALQDTYKIPSLNSIMVNLGLTINW